MFLGLVRQQIRDEHFKLIKVVLYKLLMWTNTRVRDSVCVACTNLHNLSSLGIAMKAQQGFNKEGIIHLVLAQHVALIHKNKYFMIVFF